MGKNYRMDATNTESEIWRMIPPEEKFELMAKAQSRGVVAAAGYIALACTLAVAFKTREFMWASFVSSPFVFQFVAGKAWRAVRPKALLEYLAAKSASRRYAFTNRGKDLSVRMMFKGHLEELYESDQIQEAMEALIANTKDAEVWVTLFGDSITMIAEHLGGAELRLASIIDSKLEIASTSPSGRDYTDDKELTITVKNKDGVDKRYRLTSKYPAALVVFEKKVANLRSQQQSVEEVASILPAPEAAPVEEDKFDSLFSF